MADNSKNAIFSEINITPLTDIFLVLLIIMMVVAPTFQSMDNSIAIPEINSGTSIEQGKVTVSVTKDGSIYLDTKKTTITALADDLTALKGDKENAELVVKADEKVKSSVIMQIMDAAQDAHYKKMIVAGEPLNKKDQKKLEEIDKTQNSSVINGATTPIPQDNKMEDWSE